MNKEQRIWLRISIVNAIISMGMLIAAAVYDIRLKYGLYITILTYAIAFVSFLMYCLVQYMSTREIISILIKKIHEV